MQEDILIKFKYNDSVVQMNPASAVNNILQAAQTQLLYDLILIEKCLNIFKRVSSHLI